MGPAVLLAPPAGEATPLKQELVRVATEWGREVAGAALSTADVRAELSDEINRVFSEHQGPLLVIWPRLPRLRREHAEAALGDIAGGCDLVLGPVIDGGIYLLGLARALPAVLALPAGAWQRQDAIELAVRVAADHQLEVGLLRAERALEQAADAEAALADPLLPGAIRRLLAGG